ncbi:MAG: ATP-dependent DNA helicase PcrA [Lachnospiraceae bacterium]|nr:ATP-dependent DNA helicase PcrA [Lachnospiraceae bacterium]
MENYIHNTLIYDNLNNMQLEAVQHTKGPLLILAGAGSGKTRVLTHRIAHLISTEHVEPWNIIAVTFTNKAAKEMRERVNDIVGYGAENVWVSTFHSTCVRILRRFIESLGYKRNFSIYDTDDQKVVMKELLKQFNYDSKIINERKALAVISSKKNELITPEQYAEEAFDDYNESKYAKLYTAYQERLKNSNALDFDDLIMKTVELFRADKEALNYYKMRFRYILVDEYQDTNTAQFELLRLMADADNAIGEHNLCVVGDDDQSIYKFRGANIYNILNFEKVFPDAKVIKLEQNYRSTQTILDAANEVIGNNSKRKSKKLWCSKGEGTPISYTRYMTDYEEANGIAASIRSNINNGVAYCKHAVLYRTNAQSRVIEEAFINMNIPYKIVGGLNFYSRKEIKDILAYLKTIDNGLDDVAVKRIINVPKRGIGITSINHIAEFAGFHNISFYEALLEADYISGVSRAKPKLLPFINLIEHYRAMLAVDGCSIVNLIKAILDDTGYLSALKEEGTDEANARIENIEELINKAVTFEDSAEIPENGNTSSLLSEFLENVALVADIDSVDEDADVVLLMTLHSAKGLEFPYVYLCGMEENLFPSAMALYSNDPYDIEEERRLCYVGITRAMEKLSISSANKRLKNGDIQYNPPSRFISEIPRYLITESVSDDYRRNVKRDNTSFSGSSSVIPKDNYTSYRDRDNNGRSTNLFTNNPYISKGSKNTSSGGFVLEYELGDKVKHIKFGCGTILAITPNGNDYDVSVEFDNFGVRKMKASFAKFTKL